jgi:hypothetical protein
MLTADAASCTSDDRHTSVECPHDSLPFDSPRTLSLVLASGQSDSDRRTVSLIGPN